MHLKMQFTLPTKWKATIINGSHTGQIISQIHNTKGIGRWYGFTLSTNLGHNIHVFTVYQSIKIESIHTAYQKQRHILLNKRISQPNPWQLLLQDLSQLIHQWNQQHDQTIICIDANDTLNTRQLFLSRFLSDTHLFPFIYNPSHYPEFHARGSACIDFIIGSIALIPHKINY
jgi:hypothetical protein